MPPAFAVRLEVMLNQPSRMQISCNGPASRNARLNARPREIHGTIMQAPPHRDPTSSHHHRHL